MNIKKKLKSYIKNDRPLKLKRIIHSQDIDLTKLEFNHGRNVLHYCCEKGSPEMLRLLLKLCNKVSKQDNNGNLPLHTALLRGLSEETTTARDTLLEIVMPLIDAYELGQDVENKDGETGFDLLKKLKKRISNLTRSKAEEQHQESVREAQEDEMWRHKLSEEAYFEYEEHQPVDFEEDDYEDQTYQENFDQFSERIWQEYKTKSLKKDHHIFWRDRKRKHTNGADGEASNKKSRQEIDEEKLRKARDQMKKNFHPSFEDKIDKLCIQKLNYERKFGHLLSHLTGRKLTFGCIPWPSLDVNHLTDVLFSDLPDDHSPEYRKYLRSQQIRWHPDRFSQKFRDHLHPEHVSKIMSKVECISQVLNRLNTDISNKV